MTDKAIRVRVTGRVQGVWFRGWMRETATRLGLSGWVRNDADGSVAALIAGPAAEVDAMLGALWQGPPAARVDGVEATPAAAPGARGFCVLR